MRYKKSNIIQSISFIRAKPLSAVINGKFNNCAEAAIIASGIFILLFFLRFITESVMICE
jgi:hypothetical protein